MNYTISKNFDETTNDKYPWLVKKVGFPLETAQACKAVNASNVEFVNSDQYGYQEVTNCTSVALCEEVEILDPLKLPIREKVQFISTSFYINGDTDNDPLDKCSFLELTADREIFATIN